MKLEWPNIFPSNGYYVVDSRRLINGITTGKREYFKTEALAKGRAEELQRSVLQNGLEHGSLSISARVDAVRGEDSLRPYGKTIADAVAFYLAHLKKQAQGGVLISEAAQQWKDSKFLSYKAGDITDDTYKTLKKRINFFEKEFSGKRLSDINASSLEPFFKNPKYARATRAGHKSVLSEFFKWCTHSDRKWMDENPCDWMRLARAEDREAEILSIKQCKTLVEKARDNAYAKETAPYVLLGLFAGLRPSELQELKWEDIDFKTHEIKVASEEIRYVPMTMTLVKSIAPYRGEGAMVGTNWRKKWDSVKTSAGFAPYPSDGMRHSFASYWLPIHNDRPKLAEIMGNSEAIIKKHYRKAITKREAEKFWRLI